MEALCKRATLPAAVAILLACPGYSLWGNSLALGAGYRTTNFTVDAPTRQLAKEIGDMAEHWRRELAKEWLGKELPPWSKSCPIKARVSPRLGAGGATSFVFDEGEVFGWRMDIQGSRERILDSVLPHEVTHTIFASHFRKPLPRWADEGACTTVEHRSEISKQENMLIEFLQTRRGIPFSSMFAMKEYPQDVLPLYAQGHSLAKFLISQRGKRAFLAFLNDGMADENWPRAIREAYGHPNLLALQNSWMDWIRHGRPAIAPAAEGILVAAHDAAIDPSSPQGTVIRGQDPRSQANSGFQANPEHGVGVITDPWMAKEKVARVDPADAPVASASPVTWPSKTQPSETQSTSPQASKTSGSVYDAARSRSTVWR